MFTPADMVWFAVVVPLWPWSHRLICGAVIGLAKRRWAAHIKSTRHTEILLLLWKHALILPSLKLSLVCTDSQVQAQPLELPGENFYTVQESLQRGGKGTHGGNLLTSCCPSVHLGGLSLQFLQVTGNQGLQNHQHLEAGKDNNT